MSNVGAGKKIPGKTRSLISLILVIATAKVFYRLL
jgi:hypothetical protein